MKPFEYLEPATIAEATQLLSSHGEKARILAGGIDLLPRMRAGLIDGDYLISIRRIPNLDYLECDGFNGLAFGAMTKLRSLETSEALRSNYRSLYDAIHQITSIQVKCTGTAVGNLCVATPASDVATVLYSLGARVEITGIDGDRSEPIETFYVDAHRTCLGQGEMVTRVLVPSPAPGTQTVFLNLVKTHADVAKVSVAVAVTVEDGSCRDAKIAIGSVAPTVIRAYKAEAKLKGEELTPQLIQAAAITASGETRPISDVRSTAGYRKNMASVLVRRALEKALRRASDGSTKEENR